MNTTAKKVARFGLLAALSLILGYFDRAIPLTWFLSGAVPGIKLGLANTVLLYAVYLMDWRASVALMLTKVFLSGFLFGSLSAILYSLSGGILSLAVMLLVRKNARAGALVIAALALCSDLLLWSKHPSPRGQMLWCMVLIGLAFLASIAVFVLTKRVPDAGVYATSLSGAVAHNVGQMIAAAAMLHTPQLLYTYLPVLVGIGAVVGCLTGLVAHRVFRALRLNIDHPSPREEHAS